MGENHWNLSSGISILGTDLKVVELGESGRTSTAARRPPDPLREIAMLPAKPLVVTSL
jgi:hypothetical protein